MAGPLGGIGLPELAIIAAIALVIFGPKNLPKLGKTVGKTMKNVREGMEGNFDEDEEAKSAAPAQPEAPAQPAAAPAPAEPAPAPAAEAPAEKPASEEKAE